MSGDETTPEPVDPPLRRALDAWPRPEAPPEFLAQLRAEFLAAPFEEKLAAAEGEQDLGPAPIVAPRWGPSVLTGRGGESAAAETPAREEPRPLWFKLATLAAIAAAIAIFYRWPIESGWRVEATSDYWVAKVDGASFSRQESARLAAAIRPGCLLEVEGGSLDLALDRRVAFRLGSGSALRFVNVPQRDALDALLVSQERGSLAVATGPDFDGSSLRVRTPSTEARVVGTEFAVDVLPQGTCVCCAEGSVRVFAAPGSADPLAESIDSELVNAFESELVRAGGVGVARGAAEAAHLAPVEALRRIWAAGR